MNRRAAQEELKKLKKVFRAVEHIDEVLEAAEVAESSVVAAGIELERLNTEIEDAIALRNAKAEDCDLMEDQLDALHQLMVTRSKDAEAKFEAEIRDYTDTMDDLRAKSLLEKSNLDKLLADRRKRLDELDAQVVKAEDRLAKAIKGYEDFKKGL